MTTNHYLSSGVGAGFTPTENYTIIGNGTFGETSSVVGKVEVKQGIHPLLAFRYIKKKFGILEKIILDRRLSRLEKAFNVAVDNGQEALGNKIMSELAREARESVLYAKGIRYFVEREDIKKIKGNIRDGHISDTHLKDYTRVIPKDVLDKKKKVGSVFDGFVIFHYYEKAIEKKLEKKQKMSEDEKRKMRDPILFGIIKETDRLYFVADWEDEHCDLTFDEIIDLVGDNKLTKFPELLTPGTAE